MPKKWLKKLSGDPQKIKEHRYLRLFGQLIHASDLWHFNRHSISRALAIGVFWSLIPIPFQMIMAAICALTFRANLALSLSLVWLTNPLTMPPIFYATYKFGSWILNTPVYPFHVALTWEWLTEQIQHIWKPLFLGSFIAAALMSTISYLAIKIIWRWWVVRQWKRRHQTLTSRANKLS